MVLQLGALRAALLSAGTSAAQADAASEEVAEFHVRLAGVEKSLAVLTWTAGANLILTLIALASVCALWPKLTSLAGQVARLPGAV